MKLMSLSLPVLAAAPIASAARARVANLCGEEVTLWSVGSSVSDPSHLEAENGTWSEELEYDDETGGKTIKITTERDGLYTGDPQLNFAYTLDDEQVWYDLSSVFGDAFEGENLVIASDDEDCPQIEWPEGTSPGGTQVQVCTSEEDITLTLCAE